MFEYDPEEAHNQKVFRVNLDLYVAKRRTLKDLRFLRQRICSLETSPC